MFIVSQLASERVENEVMISELGRWWAILSIRCQFIAAWMGCRAERGVDELVGGLDVD